MPRGGDNTHIGLLSPTDIRRLATALGKRPTKSLGQNFVHDAGTVRRIAPYITAVEKQARTVEVDVYFDQPDEARGLLVGYSADVEIVLDHRSDVLRIPTAALREGNKVLVLGADGVLAERGLRTGLANWEQTEVLEGLAAGDLLVTSLERAGVAAGAHAVAEAATAGH